MLYSKSRLNENTKVLIEIIYLKKIESDKYFLAKRVGSLKYLPKSLHTVDTESLGVCGEKHQ